jgi:hypothetical protein
MNRGTLAIARARGDIVSRQFYLCGLSLTPCIGKYLALRLRNCNAPVVKPGEPGDAVPPSWMDGAVPPGSWTVATCAKRELTVWSQW